MDFDILQTFLIERGYSIAVREEGWVSVLIHRGEERWLGDGEDEADALADAVLKMFPSTASWELLREVLTEAHALAELADTAALEEPDGEPPTLELPAVQKDDQPIGIVIDVPPDAVVDAAAPAEKAEPAASPTHEDVLEPALESLDLPPESTEITALPEPTAPDESVTSTPEPPAQPHLSVAEALEGVANLAETVDALLPEVAWMAPPNIRLQLTAWLARARHFQDGTMHAPEVESAVRDLAGRLHGVSKRWWPGNVAALQLNTTPVQAARGVKLDAGKSPTWNDVAEAIEVLLEDEADGWADGRALEPRPVGVDVEFRRIVQDMENLLGTLHLEPDMSVLSYVNDAATGQVLRGWAQRLRWMRGVAPSGEQWARAMGRLRWTAQKSPTARRHLDPVLAPNTTPREGTWARAMGEDPSKKLRQRKLRGVLRDTPGDTANPEVVATWLARALQLGADLTNRQVTGLLKAHHAVLLGLSNEDLGEVERNVRSRLRKLQKALKEGHAPAAPPEVEPDAGDAEEEGSADPVGDLIDAVRARVAGQSAVFVSNRTDNGLQEKLEKRLGLSIDWCDGSPRKLQAVSKQILGGSYQLVILATGFAGHDADGLLGKAASRAGVPFVRAYKGRPLATLRAIARDLGIRNEME